MPDGDSFEAALADARAAVAGARIEALTELADRMAAIAGDGADPEAVFAAAELYALAAHHDRAEALLARARAVYQSRVAETIDRRLSGVRVLRALGAELAALALAAGAINAQHPQVSPRERGVLEAKMSAIELRLEAAGLDLDALEGGFDEILASYWGVHYAALFRLALGVESLVGELFPDVARSDIIGTARESLALAMPLVAGVIGRDGALALQEAMRRADVDAVRTAGAELFRAAGGRARL